MRRPYLLLGLCLFLSASTRAQQSYPRLEVFGGYSYMHTSILFQDSIPKGWNASVTGNLRRNIGIEADISGHYGGTPPGFSHSDYLFMAGPRYAARLGKAVPWAHALLGGAHPSVKGPSLAEGLSVSHTWFAWAIGGGLDVRLHRHLWLRVIQADYVRVNGTADFFEGGRSGISPGFEPKGSNNLRLSFGVVVGL